MIFIEFPNELMIRVENIVTIARNGRVLEIGLTHANPSVQHVTYRTAKDAMTNYLQLKAAMNNLGSVLSRDIRTGN